NPKTFALSRSGISESMLFFLIKSVIDPLQPDSRSTSKCKNLPITVRPGRERFHFAGAGRNGCRRDIDGAIARFAARTAGGFSSLHPNPPADPAVPDCAPSADNRPRF